jgi:hypothetical protein
MKEDGNPFKGEESKDWIKKIDALKKMDLGRFYELVFTSIVNFSEEAIKDGSPKKNKIRALDRLIEHFQDLEEYEKCAALKKVLDQIKENE